MRESLVRVLGIVVLGVAIAGCSAPPASSGSPVSAPRRIVSLTPALTEVLFAVGAGDRVVGVTDYCDFPEQVKSLPKVGGYVNPSVEAVLALHPDLVVISPGPGNRDAATAMQRAGLHVVPFAAETLEDSLAAIEAVAAATGDGPKGAALAKTVRERLSAVAAKVAGRPRVRALFCIQTDPIIAAGAGTLPSQLLEAAGGTNVVDAPRYPRMDVEAVAAAKPDVILQSRMDVARDDGRIEAAFWGRWSSIPAVANRRVVVLPDDLTLRPGPRVAEAAEELARILHGDDFHRESR